MFEIYGGKAAFDQWDLNQRVTCSCLKVGDPVVFNAHGKRHADKAYAKDGGVWADVPNFLLQKHGSIRVELGHGLDVHLNCRTYFDVVKKDKPADYDCPYNVVLEGGNSGGASSWNDLKDKPFYSEEVEKTVECTSGLDGDDLYDFPVFAVGDTVTVKVDGVEYSLVAFDDDECVTIGDSWVDLENGTGQFGWQICGSCFSANEAHTVSYVVTVYHAIPAEYLPQRIEASRVIDSEDGFEKTLLKEIVIPTHDSTAYLGSGFVVENGSIVVDEYGRLRLPNVPMTEDVIFVAPKMVLPSAVGETVTFTVTDSGCVETLDACWRGTLSYTRLTLSMVMPPDLENVRVHKICTPFGGGFKTLGGIFCDTAFNGYIVYLTKEDEAYNGTIKRVF